MFLHTPWPTSDIVRSLPVRGELLRTILCHDQIGFQIFDYCNHFLTVCTKILNLQHSFKFGGILSLEYQGRSINLGSKHLCLDPVNLGFHILSDCCGV